jgi:phthiocerol/phenolphthiocerol synthesis type-I polyketide synthase E
MPVAEEHSLPHLDTALRVGFVLPGMGSVYEGMGADLYTAVPKFRAVVDECAPVIEAVLGFDITEWFTRARRPSHHREDTSAPAGLPGTAEADGADQDSAALPERVAHPMLFVFEYAMACTLMEHGVQPGALLGHSLGEIVAACVAGVFDLADGLEFACRRLELMSELPPGAMLAVRAPESVAARYTGDQVFVAAVNSPNDCVLSGTVDATAAARSRIERDGGIARLLPIEHPAHTPLLLPAASGVRRYLRWMALRPPRIPLVSSVTGTWIDAHMWQDPEYWARQLTATVRFAAAARVLAAATALVVRVGPGKLGAWLEWSAAPGGKVEVIGTVRDRHDDSDDVSVLEAALRRLGMSHSLA